MEDFPRDLWSLRLAFRTEAGLPEYLFRPGWPEGFCWPRCGGAEGLAEIRVLLHARL